jgi:DNA replication and repair protein RecF
MQITRLALASFRNYSELDAEFGPGAHVVFGPNAAGKTSLLEAMALLGEGTSHRASGDSDLISWGADFARLEAGLAGVAAGEGPTTLEIVLARSGLAGARKRIRINGVGRRPSQLAVTLPVVLFAPEDMLLIVGSPSLRRHALDAIVVRTVPTAAATLATYTRALTQRNNLLKAIRDGGADPAELRFWSDTVAREGGMIVSWRKATLAALVAPLAAAHAEIAPGDEAIRLSYISNAEPGPDEDAEAALRRRLAETAEKEMWNGTTLVGPHRDDVSFSLGGRDMSGFASRGQQRSAILSFKLAELELVQATSGRPPLLLLDDVFSELDPERRAHLVRRIGELPQAFVTTTALEDLDPALVATATTWQVTAGRLAPAGRRLGLGL